MDTHNSIMDIHNWIMDIHNWTMDINKWIMDIQNWLWISIITGFMRFWLSIRLGIPIVFVMEMPIPGKMVCILKLMSDIGLLFQMTLIGVRRRFVNTEGCALGSATVCWVIPVLVGMAIWTPGAVIYVRNKIMTSQHESDVTWAFHITYTSTICSTIR